MVYLAENLVEDGYCRDYYWVSFCDMCGDGGGPDCADGETPNHNCDRWGGRRFMVVTGGAKWARWVGDVGLQLTTI